MNGNWGAIKALTIAGLKFKQMIDVLDRNKQFGQYNSKHRIHCPNSVMDWTLPCHLIMRYALQPLTG